MPAQETANNSSDEESEDFLVDAPIDFDYDINSKLNTERSKARPKKHFLAIESARMSVAHAHQELKAVEHIRNRVKLLDHQLDAAHSALFRMNGGALFADEVGLGKTIEIGMVLKEMDFRNTHDSFLVLTPAQLANQWRRELNEKFGLGFVSNYDDGFENFRNHDKIVASVDTAKSGMAMEEVLSRTWDAVILDEAHYVRNDDTDRYDLLDALDYEYAFFATATPLQNDITDLYNIIDLIRPGVFGSYEEFESKYITEDGSIKNGEQFRNQLNKVMIRNRRAETDIDFTNRDISTRTFKPSEKEKELYEKVSSLVRSTYSTKRGRHLVLLTLQKEVVSSPSALLGTVEKRLDKEDEELDESERKKLLEIEKIASSMDETTKQKYLKIVLENVQENIEKGRAIVFTEFRNTQNEIVEVVREMDSPVHTVNGDYSSKEKDMIIQEFEEEGGILVTTDAISEGRNIQFCNVLINYDLPWNPMKVEQRIGRVDRIRQDREVYVFNLALEETIEEHVLNKLYSKINLFQQSVGDLKEILSGMESSGKEFKNEVFTRLVDADDERELENNFEEMAVSLQHKSEAVEKLEDFNKDVFEGFEFGGDKDE
ncbi:MAG: ATP-dependent helicase [Nanohaloarchaea archaeon SW_7_43_1]|nr:MAG: ATP-dependent helicase [Nanohaloarchaea archaeon SW_7_43_1]